MTRDRVVILGAGRALRGGPPSAIVDIDRHGRVLDWLLDVYGGLHEPDVHFVGGYRADEIVERYPRLRVVFNRQWETTGSVHSLALVPVDADGSTFVTYADIVYRRNAVELIASAAGDVVLAVDTAWRARYVGRGREDLEAAEKVELDGDRLLDIGAEIAVDTANAEFAGIVRLSPNAAAIVGRAMRAGDFTSRAAIPDLVRYCVAAGLDVRTVDLHGAWAELNAPQDLARFVLGTKAESLERLRGMQHGGEIGALVMFTDAEWRASRDTVVERVLSEIPAPALIVRSSALNEDSWTESGAGRYVSVADVERTPGALASAVDTVLTSYGVPVDGNQVLVQEMLRDVAMSGVVMTRTHALGAPYCVLNFDDRTSRTDTVTSGGEARTVICHRGSPLRPELPSALSAVLATVRSIERLVGHDSLDIEFAVTRDESVHILQVRPIATSHLRATVDDAIVLRGLVHAERFLVDHAAASPSLVGQPVRYSVMSDWNPAEIVGTKPRRLAASLYRYLITDEVWARQRSEFGYRDTRPCPLIVDIVGHPYVDVRASFNSFIPASLPEPLAVRLCDHYLERLAADPHLHDKIEFEIAITCLTPGFEAAAKELLSVGFDAREVDALREGLRHITAAAFTRGPGDYEALEAMEARTASIEAIGASPLEAAYHQLDAARRYGTVAFAHLARCAFVATTFVRSLVTLGTLDAARADSYLSSIETVFGTLRTDASLVARGELAWSELVVRYGHLRPGTYDITSPCYARDPERYLRRLVETANEPEAHSAEHRWTESERLAISASLRALDLDDDVDRFDSFVRASIAGREYGKFVFTKPLSAALEHLADFGAAHGLTRDDVAHLTIDDLLSCRDALLDPDRFLQRRVAEGREAHLATQAVCLPGQIASTLDLYCFEQARAEPNFVTLHSVEGHVTDVDANPDSDVEGRIVMIPSADPGYDWLLARGIAGLVTMYGGANSHMAVRATEIGLPAAIGVGEQLYEMLLGAAVVRVDCASRTIVVVA